MITINNNQCLVNEEYKLGRSYFSSSAWKEYKDWVKEQKKAQNRSKKKGVGRCPPVMKKPNRKAGNGLKSNSLTYEEQLKDERWLKKRKEVLESKGYICADCGSRYDLQVHHLEYKHGKMAWDYPMSNFVVLCSRCHKKMHGL